MRFGALLAISLLTILFSISIGCSKKDVQEYIPNVVENIPKVVEEKVQPKVVLDQNGSGVIQLDTETKFDACYVSLVSLPERGSVLKIKSYVGDQENVPGFYVHAQVDATQLSELVDTTVPTKLYVQTSADGGIWSTNQEPATIEFGQDKDRYVVTITDGILQNSVTESRHSVSGKLECVDIGTGE